MKARVSPIVGINKCIYNKKAQDNTQSSGFRAWMDSDAIRWEKEYWRDQDWRQGK